MIYRFIGLRHEITEICSINRKHRSNWTVTLTGSLPNNLGKITVFFLPSVMTLAFPGFLAIFEKMLARIAAHLALRFLRWLTENMLTFGWCEVLSKIVLCLLWLEGCLGFSLELFSCSAVSIELYCGHFLQDIHQKWQDKNSAGYTVKGGLFPNSCTWPARLIVPCCCGVFPDKQT